jgi:hypothetical protein
VLSYDFLIIIIISLICLLLFSVVDDMMILGMYLLNGGRFGCDVSAFGCYELCLITESTSVHHVCTS